MLSAVPTRIVTDRDGHARAPRHGDNYDVVFVRDDGWSLAAPEHLRDVAHALWADAWVETIECPGTTLI